MTAPPTLCVGRLYCDLIFSGLPRLPSLGTEIYASGLEIHPGGGACITAAHLAALGHASALASMLPAPPFAEGTRAGLEAAGVDLRLSRAMPRGTEPQVTVALTGPKDRAFVTRRSGPACPALSAGDLKRLGAGHLHIGELATLVERPDLLALARQSGMTVSLDCAWDETLTPGDIAPLLPHVDVFLPNAEELGHLRSLGMVEQLPALTVVKQGAAGAMALSGGTERHDAALSVTPVDTTGAGDAFNAGFLSHWLRQEDLGSCLAAGNARGARAIRHYGGFQAMEQPKPLRAAALTATEDP